jgi:hypothetical protein
MLIDLLLLLVPAGALGTFVWLAQGAILPLGGLDYLVITPPARTLAIAVGAAFLGLVVLHRAVSRQTRSRSISYNWPLFLLFAALLGPFAARHAGAGWSAPLAYFTIDLRLWLAAAVILLWLATLDRHLHGVLRAAVSRRLSPRARHRLALSSLTALVVIVPILTTPHLRFSGEVHGDEPKYLRYCENLYQGRGFEVGEIKNIADLPPGMPPKIGSDLRAAAHVIPIEIHDLSVDAHAILRGRWHHAFNRAVYEENWFVQGKNGGLYQVHTPGLSFLLFPGYVIDRYFLNRTSLFHPQFPTNPWATETTLLLIYAVWAIAIFRFFRAQTGHVGLAWIVAALALLSMPAAAFPFQIYPETTAGLIIITTAGYLLFSEKRRLSTAFAVGLMVGYLPWLHVRFGLLSTIPLIWMIVAERRRPKLAGSFVAGYALVVSLFCFYVYHITGSILPTALYYTQGAANAFNPHAVIPGTIGFFFDGVWGMFAHTPVLLLAALGVPLLMAQRPAVALLAAMLFAALIIPSAGHGYTAAGGTPLRDLVAVMPLVWAALVEAAVAYRHSRVFQVVFAVLALVSLQTATAYNLFHVKEVGPLVDQNVSGWHVNLLFPPLHDGVLNPMLLAGWIAVVVVLMLISVVRLDIVRSRLPRVVERTCAAGTIALLLASLAIVGWYSRALPHREESYLMPPATARSIASSFR